MTVPFHPEEIKAERKISLLDTGQSGYLQCLAFARERALHSSSKTLSVKMSVFNILLCLFLCPLAKYSGFMAYRTHEGRTWTT